jgi:hypothetical protein
VEALLPSFLTQRMSGTRCCSKLKVSLLGKSSLVNVVFGQSLHEVTSIPSLQCKGIFRKCMSRKSLWLL